MKITNNSISLAGEFAVLSKLALYGYDASMTLGHTKHVDILVSHPKTGKMYQLEVKTKFGSIGGRPTESYLFGNSSGWVMQEKHEKIMDKNLFYCFVDMGAGVHPTKFFIVPSKVVAQYCRAENRLWLRDDRSHKQITMRTFRIGFSKRGYQIPTPSAKRYENNWQFK